MADYPSFRPSSRSIKLGKFPVKTYRMMNGTRVKRSYGRQAFGYILTLGYNNVPDTTALGITDHYLGELGLGGFIVPAAVFSGISNSTLLSRLRTPTNIEWEYAEEPDINNVFTNVNVIAVTLIGELNYP